MFYVLQVCFCAIFVWSFAQAYLLGFPQGVDKSEHLGWLVDAGANRLGKAGMIPERADEYDKIIDHTSQRAKWHSITSNGEIGKRKR